MIRRYLLVTVPAVTLFLACGDDDDGGGGTPVAAGTDGGGSSSSGAASSSSSGGSEAGGSPCPAIAAAVCAYGKRCFPGFIEETTCESAETILCEHQRKLPGYSTTPIPASCVEVYQSAACTGVQTPAGLLADECNPKGSLDNGAACEEGEQCKTGNCFTKSGSTARCGVCADYALEGADCAEAKCKLGLYCLGTKTPGERKCKPLDALGAECTIGSCAFPNKCVGGTCKAPLADGMDCTHPATDESPCEKSCLQGSHQCGPSPNVFVKAGDKCEGVALICPAGTSCQGPKGDQRCVLDARAGETCNDETGPECTQGFVCAGGKCEERPLDACK